jgi:hypothetical protein
MVLEAARLRQSPLRAALEADVVAAPVRAGVIAVWLAFVWLTTHWYSWQRTIDLLFGSDMREYERVARAAPGFPSEPLPTQHAARFVPHYLVGLISDGLGVGDREVYYVAAFVLLVAILVVLDRLIAPLPLGLGGYALCVGALIANPYLFRFLVVSPARLADSVFVLGVTLAFLGLVRTSVPLLVAGLVVATIGRSESMLPIVLLAPLGVWLSPDWRRRSVRLPAVAAAAAFAAPALTYSLVRIADRSFSESDYHGFMRLTIFGALADLPGSAGHIGGQLARTFAGVAGVAGLLGGVLLARWRSARGVRVPFAAWAAMIGGAAVALEAVALNPYWLNGNEPLLSALAASLLVVAAATVFAASGFRIRGLPALLAVAGLVLTSLHHRFSSVSPVHRASAYAALAVAGALVVAAAVWRGAVRAR